mmetsp:Transcript_63513/g.143253  ORF Transcript_63513/g.143253 Transcript_63513/m.143253 type:complete len:214 (-) Transcript_63513:182-823(-)
MQLADFLSQEDSELMRQYTPLEDSVYKLTPRASPAVGSLAGSSAQSTSMLPYMNTHGRPAAAAVARHTRAIYSAALSRPGTGGGRSRASSAFPSRAASRGGPRPATSPTTASGAAELQRAMEQFQRESEEEERAREQEALRKEQARQRKKISELRGALVMRDKQVEDLTKQLKKVKKLRQKRLDEAAGGTPGLGVDSLHSSVAASKWASQTST